MSHSTHSYAPLDSTPYNTEPQYPPSTPPPLYSSNEPASHPDPPLNGGGGGGYRTSQNMTYSKQESPYLPSGETSSTAALLSERDITEKDTSITPSNDKNDFNDIDTSYPAIISSIRSRSISPGKSYHYRGKRYLSLTRTIISCINIFLATASLIAIAIVIWGIYAKNKDKTRLSISAPNQPSKEIIRAFPREVDTLPNNLIISASAFTMFSSLILSLVPCFRSEKKFHKKRLAISEIFEIVMYAITVAIGGAAGYFAMTGKSDTDHNLWGYVCKVTRDPSPQSQRLLFLNQISYRNACSNYDTSVYLLLAFTGLSALALATFLINICLKKKRGEYRRDDSEFCTSVCECCGACAGPIIDCAIICQCCFACCSLFK
ncbi:hypothetical protein TWF481_008371 [Arthrobotrys musiformis]|uniref:MARVEL domain-containing protein n=1 Tax=Arthrobotrys musiformis TaxID=47236 RepID=A0AAV9W732_9PEZI